MKQLLYDGSFEGFLTVVFEVYEYRFLQPKITRQSIVEGSLFEDVYVVQTNMEKSERVYAKLQLKISPIATRKLYKCYLSELPGIEDVMLRYIQHVIATKNGGENDYGYPDVLAVQQASKKVDREKHRMEAFVRFQLLKDDLYYAIIQPDFNVLPLIAKHFRDRYADQRWIVYDCRRKYGLYYDLEDVSEVAIDFNGKANRELHDPKDELYQDLWKQYFDSVNISARKNTKLHVQHLPKRYWKYLTEKQ